MRRVVRAVPVRVVVGETDDACARGADAPLRPVQAVLLAHADRVAALLRGAHHRDAGVLVRLEGIRRVDDERESPTHPTCLRGHELDRRADLRVGQRRVAGLRRHRAFALDDRLHQRVDALLEARCPGRLVAELRRAGDRLGVAGEAHLVVDRFAVRRARRRLGSACRLDGKAGGAACLLARAGAAAGFSLNLAPAWFAISTTALWISSR